MTERLYPLRLPARDGAASPGEPRPWRSLRELGGHAEADASRAGELPSSAAHPPSEIDRRAFMRLAGGTLALASGGGCAVEAPRKIVPYARAPRDVVPGTSRFYATSMPLDGYATGLLVASREGRPIKIEGNPDHPASLGGTGVFEQASIRQLYDDQRARAVRFDGEVSSWEDLFAALRAPRTDGGAGLRVLMEPTGSPFLLALVARLVERHPQARVAFHSAVRHEAAVAGAALAFGRPLLPQYDLARADAVVSLDADFLTEHPFSLRYARQWAGRRRPDSGEGDGGAGAGDGGMSRLYVVESQLSVTGSMADNRLRLPLSRVPDAAASMAARLPLPDALAGAALARASDVSDELAAWGRTVAADLERRPRGTTLVMAGDRQPPAVHALAHAVNEALGNVGETVTFTAPVVPLPGGALQAFEDQVADMRAGRVDTLLILEVNPIYTAPADLRYREALERVPDAFCLAYYEHETAERCRWFGPAAHYLESWGDARAHDGTVSMIQPLVRPLADARTPAELLAAAAGDPAPDAHGLLHGYWTRERGLPETAWQRALQLGVVPDTAAPPVVPSPSLRDDAAARALDALPRARVTPRPGRLEVELYPSPTLYDGRFANNPWLLEQPTPIGKLTWDNAALVSPATARALGVEDEQLLEVRALHAGLRAPVLIVPGMADGVAALWLGYGRKGQETNAAGAGVDAYPLRTRAHLHTVPDASATVHGERYPLALTQLHFHTHDRPIALRRTLEEYRRDPQFTGPYRGPVSSMVPEHLYEGNQWAMSIDLGTCVGCGACTVACQAENNLPVVGKEGVRNSREMSWLRIDTYFFGSPSDPRLVHQPMMCQHCEKAPCEYVCPVEATVHSPDGLNEMVYNRCVGTRFCSNNCPYKVRRFNWFDWGERIAMNRGLVDLQYNPEVTVRERGVMEKCTYCVQRIRRAEIDARLEERALRPGEVMTACQAACPTGAIQFGSLSHPDTDMVRWRQQDRSYAVLQHEEGTQPRTYYLARIDDPNPELA